MRLSVDLNSFKSNHKKKKNQIIYSVKNCKDYTKVENLFNFVLAEKNSFIFESVEKGTIRSRYTIIGLNPDKIWNINKNLIIENFEGKKTSIKEKPLIFLNKLINKFNINTPKALPKMCTMLVGYFSYDIIRYIENIPDNCFDDLNIPDVRLMRPKNLIIYDNFKKKIFFIENIYSETKINNYFEKYHSIKENFQKFDDYSNIKLPIKFSQTK